MVAVKVTVDVQGRAVAADKVADATVRSALTKMGREIGQKLSKVACPEHAKGPTDVRVHVSLSGDADLKYESCCEKLRGEVSRALG
ncbi:MAG: hypothetical protein JNL38_22980 [Myxococcales bacterium]|jgi:predicted hydrocarbon binding protein|nr:hypothetical protein [Myxococcales bacterium]